jgi:hypothetical protein
MTYGSVSPDDLAALACAGNFTDRNQVLKFCGIRNQNQVDGQHGRSGNKFV